MSTFKEADLAEAGLLRLRSLSKMIKIKSESQTFLMFLNTSKMWVWGKYPILRYDAFKKSDH